MGESTSKLTSPSQASAAKSVPGLSESLRENSAANTTKLKQSKLIQHSLTESLASCTPYDFKKQTLELGLCDMTNHKNFCKLCESRAARLEGSVSSCA